ncbi:MAG: efflux RND transporter permease subunit [Saprospiraceae bacterium]|nr:efflux RND transporter permease subunit [Saprospiraceae bacterium]
MRKTLAYFIKYPVAVNILMIALVLFGIAGILATKSSFFPLNESQIINIQVAYPGASPEEMEEGVVLKIEDNLRGLVGIDRVTSTSSENTAMIMVETLDDYDIDVVLQDVKNAVDRVPTFPTGMEPPVIAKQEIRNEAISLTVSGDGVNLRTLKQIARDIETDFRAMEGISQVVVNGFPQEEIEIAVREKDLRAYGLTFAEVSEAVANSNILTTGGNIKTDTEEYLIRANSRSYYGDELDFIVVRANAVGDVVRLKDVAEVRDKWAENPDRLYFNGNAAIQIRVSATENEDLISNADQVNAYLEKFNQQYDNVQLNVTRDASVTLKQRTQLLMENGGMGIMLVLILLSIFLRPSLAFWVAIGLPISFFGMFIFAPTMITINVLSLFGMIIVIGILVDDGIVIGENIYQHYERGKSPIQAAIDGTLEVTPPIISAILTTMVAFSAFFFLDGRIGEFFSEVSIVVILTLGISLLEALVILPSHIAHSNAMKKGGTRFWINRVGDRIMQFLRDKVYSPLLWFFMQNKVLGFAIPIAFLIISVGAIGGGLVKVTFFPRIASDRVLITLKMPQGTSEEITDSIITVMERAAWVVNDDFTERQTDGKQVVENTIKRVGPGTSNATLEMNLLPGEERDFPALTIANAVEKEVGIIYGVESIEYGSGSNFGGRPVSISFVGNNISDLKGAKEDLKRKLGDLPQLKDISDNDPAGIKEIDITLKENAYLLGLTNNDVMRQVRSGFFGASVQRFQRGRDEIRVWVRYDRQNRSSIKNLDDMWIMTPSGARVPLSEIAEYEIARGDVAINHLDGKRVIIVDANLKDQKASATDIQEGIRQNIMPEILARYPTVTPLYEGQNREAGKLIRSVWTVVPAILFLIYAIIAFTFRSYSQPILLFLMVPFSMIGVALGHYVHGFPINMLSWLGIIALIGIMVNDGLVLIGKFNLFLRDGLPFEEALYEAGRTRFRPIFLTSLTTIAGLAPLIFETSRQAQFLIPMAISIAYGIGVATFLTLFMLPLLLSVNNYFKVGGIWLFKGRRPSREEVERPVQEVKREKEEEELASVASVAE